MTRTLPTVSGGRGPRFIRHIGIAASVTAEHPQRQEDEPALWPDDPGEASILVTDGTVDTLVPENVATRLVGLGVKALIASGFGEQLYAACVAHGVLPVLVGEEELEGLSTWVGSNPELKMTVDLEKRVIERPDVDPLSFSVDERMRNKLLLGLTDLEEAMRQTDAALDFRSADRRRRPWLYANPEA